MNKRFIKTPLKGVTVHDAKDVGTRTVNLLMGEHVGEYVRGDIMDANAVIQAFDELRGNVDTNHDTLEEIVAEIHTNANSLNAEITRAKAAEQANATHIANETTRATAKETELQNAINELKALIAKYHPTTEG